ncbi:MAG: hypothetical protein V4590_06930 [Bacteroidota bacterium]
MLAALTFLGFAASAQQGKQNLKEARNKMAAAKSDLRQAQKDSVAEYHQFRKESLVAISENNKKIEELRVKKDEKDKAASKDFTTNVKSLEAQNTALRESVNNYRADGNTNWVVFKREWTKQMKALQESFKESRYE